MKQFTIILDGQLFSPEKFGVASKCFSEMLQIGKVKAGDVCMSINFPKEQEAEILALAEKYGIVDLTKMV